jgi:predicted membrane-bound dolichyl-phosphate-mannose-protein mannosyltransferase
MNNNKTSVEWLFQKLWDEPKDKFTWYAILKEAKEMEKQQIMEAVDVGFEEGAKFPEDIKLNNAEQYYNETFGGKDEQQ